MRMVDKSNTHTHTHTLNFVISSQDFHIEFERSVINLTINTYLSFKPGSSQNGKFQEGMGGLKLSSQNGSLLLKTGELEHMFAKERCFIISCQVCLSL